MRSSFTKSGTAFEDYVERQVAGGRSIIGLYPPSPEARAEYEAFRAKAKDAGRT